MYWSLVAMHLAIGALQVKLTAVTATKSASQQTKDIVFEQFLKDKFLGDHQ